jgi:protein transport protein SEC24
VSKLEDAREALKYKLIEILSVYKTAFNQSTHPQQMMISDNLRLLPVYILSLLKNVSYIQFRWRSKNPKLFKAT